MSETWADRLQQAIVTDDEIATLADREPRDDLARVAFEAIGFSVLERLAASFDYGFAHVESPLEEAMCWALIVEGYQHCDTVDLTRAGPKHRISTPVPCSLWIEPQVQFGRYRVDFLLTLRDHWSFDRSIDAQLIVEVDGHDYHERTKTQARRDKARDRALQELGLRVLHFTGAEVWENPILCARDALRQLQQLTLTGMARALDGEDPEV